MIKTFTQNDVLRYYYNETSEQESAEIKQALIINADLMEVYKQLKSSGSLLDEVKKEPSKQVIDKILNYSKFKNLNSVCE